MHPVYRVIFHIDEEDKWPLLLGNVKNLLASQDLAEIEVVANAAAVAAYQSKEFVTQMTDLNGQGVQFVACQNALNAQHISKEDLLKFVSVVPAGIVELVKKQNSGYVYIKP
ncbi:DsrE family protein [Sporolactobacillus pectinivorans]|uniref:DsrE family protein n=1 Tax=Sporolactobacillus pectinivorans TaxID=1591408 RepID=UPI000C263BD4|nr:DsrE family protein [Sporolactobacillus pectinivorans]